MIISRIDVERQSDQMIGIIIKYPGAPASRRGSFGWQINVYFRCSPGGQTAEAGRPFCPVNRLLMDTPPGFLIGARQRQFLRHAQFHICRPALTSESRKRRQRVYGLQNHFGNFIVMQHPSMIHDTEIHPSTICSLFRS